MEAFTKSVQSSGEGRGSSKRVEASVQDKKREKRVRLVSPSRESETDKKIKALEEMVEKQGQELKKFRQAIKNSNNENVRQSNAPSENASLSQLVYAPYPSVPFRPSFVANGGNLGQYPNNAGPNFQEQYGTGWTYEDPSGGNARQQTFAPHGRGGGFNMGMARGHKNPKPFVPYDTCARCGEKGHWRNEAHMKGIVLLRHRNSQFRQKQMCQSLK